MTAFRFNPRPTVWANVKLHVPTEAGFEEQTFRARFLILPLAERQAMAEDGARDALGQVWLDWDGIVDADGRPIPFSEALRAEFLEFDYIEFGLSQAYARAAMGIEAKN